METLGPTDAPSRVPEGQALPEAQQRVSVPVALDGESRGRRWGLGVGSVGAAFAMVVATIVGSISAGTAFGAAALPLAVVALALSLGAIGLGIAAAVRDAGRAPGIVGAVLGVLLNPVLLALALPAGPP